MYKALISDIDGTIIVSASDGKDIPNGIIESVGKAIASGKYIGLASGRGYESAKNVINKLGIIHPCILEGGSLIADPISGKTLWEKQLNSETVTKLLDIFREFIPIKTAADISMHHTHFPIDNLPTSYGDERYVYVLGISEKLAIQLQNIINEWGQVSAHLVHKSWRNPELVDLHCVHPEGTKEHGIAEWRRLLDIQKEEVIGIGDGANDLPLFDGVGLKVAVENASIVLKDAADIIAPAFDNGALEQIINKYLLDQSKR